MPVTVYTSLRCAFRAPATWKSWRLGAVSSALWRVHREATAQQLIHATRPRLDTMLAHGTTTAEIKSGYGLETRSELTMLRVIEQLDSEHPIDLVPTFLGAHTTPPERNSDSEGYLEAVIDEMLPEVVSWYERSGFSARQVPLFCDVFLEDHAFNVAQSERLLRIAQELGLPSKLHVDQFNSLGGIPMGIDLGAISVDHLEVTTGDDIQRLGASDTIAVLLPAVNFNLGLTNFANGRALVAAGAVVALATDLNPGSSPCFSMPLVMAIATRYLGLSPAEALNAATINAAHAIGLGDCAGSLEAGKQADLVMIDAPDYRHLAYLLGVNLVHTVIKRGEIVVGA